MLLFGLSMIPMFVLVYKTTQPGRIPLWLFLTATISFLAPMTALGLFFVASMFFTKRDRRALLDDLNFSLIDEEQLELRHTEIITDPHQRVLSLGADLDRGWMGMYKDSPVELLEFSTRAGNNKVKTMLASTEVFPPANTVCLKRPLVPMMKRFMPKQLKGVGSARVQRDWLVYGDRESASHFLSDPVCEYIEEMPKFKFMILWSQNRFHVGLVGLPTREGVEYLLRSSVELARIGQIRNQTTDT